MATVTVTAIVMVTVMVIVIVPAHRAFSVTYCIPLHTLSTNPFIARVTPQPSPFNLALYLFMIVAMVSFSKMMAPGRSWR